MDTNEYWIDIVIDTVTPVIEMLIDLASRGKTTEFIETFDNLAMGDVYDDIVEYEKSLGIAAITGGSVPILSHIDAYFETISRSVRLSWLNHSVNTLKLEMTAWILKGLVCADNATVGLALKTGNMDMIRLILDSYGTDPEDLERIDYTCAWPNNPETLDAIFETLGAPEKMITTGADIGDISFLERQRDKCPLIVLNNAIRCGIAKIFTFLKSPEEISYAFCQFAEYRMTNEIVALTSQTTGLDEISLYEIMNMMPEALTLGDWVVQIIVSLSSPETAESLLSLLSIPMTFDSEQYLSILSATIKYPAIFISLLKRPEIKTVESLDMILIRVMKEGKSTRRMKNWEVIAFRRLVDTGLCDLSSSRVKKAITEYGRDIERIMGV